MLWCVWTLFTHNIHTSQFTSRLDEVDGLLLCKMILRNRSGWCSASVVSAPSLQCFVHQSQETLLNAPPEPKDVSCQMSQVFRLGGFTWKLGSVTSSRKQIHFLGLNLFLVFFYPCSTFPSCVIKLLTEALWSKILINVLVGLLFVRGRVLPNQREDVDPVVLEITLFYCNLANFMLMSLSCGAHLSSR